MPCHLDQLKILKTITTSMFLLSMPIASIARITMCCQHNVKVPCNYLIRKNQAFKQLNDTKTRLFDTKKKIFFSLPVRRRTGAPDGERKIEHVLS
jgi:hypothetical protein